MSLYYSKAKQPNDCIFCETPNAKRQSGILDGNIYACPICGNYTISRTELGLLEPKNQHQEEKLKVAQLLAEKKLTSNVEFKFVNGAVEDLLKTYPYDMLKRLDRALLNLSRLVTDPYDKICFSLPQLTSKQEDAQEYARIVALLFASINTAQVALDHMVQNGWLRVVECQNTDYAITSKGWEYIRELKKRPAGDTKQAFVAMWFAESRTPYFRDGIKRACDETGYVPFRIDLKQHNEKICDAIIAEIRKSRILIADMTGNIGGVYFEAGFALGLGLPVIYLFDKASFDTDGPHFDTRQYNHIVYENENDLLLQLKNRILATVPIE